MAIYRVINASVNLHAGVLGLEPHQARARQHRLKPLGGNCYEVIVPPVAFKRGEEFEYEGELPKHLVEMVVAQGPSPAVDADPPIEDGPDDGVAQPPKRKKGARSDKPAA